MLEALSRNFQRHEFVCPCCHAYGMDPVLLTRLQALRDTVQIPLIVVSGFRCDQHNLMVGGKPGSKHLLGQAVDLRIKNFDPATRYRLIKTAFAMGFTGVGIGKVELHLDVRNGQSVSWGY